MKRALTLLDKRRQRPHISLLSRQPLLCRSQRVFLREIPRVQLLVCRRRDERRVVDVRDDHLDVLVLRVLLQVLEFELAQEGLHLLY